MTDPQQIAVLEEVIRTRRSCRSFSGQVPDEVLEKIVEAAVYAPFAAGTGIPLKDIRRIFIFRQGTDTMDQARQIITTQLRSGAFKIGMAVRLFPFLRNKMLFFADRLNATAEKGIPALTEGSFYIVAAEKKGFPPIAKQSLAHVMENMWLTATAHGVGFQMLSVTNSLTKNTQFMNLLGLPPKGWALTGCMIGNPKQQPKGMRDRRTEQFIRWVE
ncbi:MAG: nitroreductase family protein [Candidatus Electrothrix aestuarii]|uniref:Nitroreductase family protein n=1 Tax=Candidatus Electrothrix aestuarii TaxID=3062594 RepID=A0AAU8M145_9BACT|nr:nitroreductase family protein [Candidatus Electrothrix aestuarii]